MKKNGYDVQGIEWVRMAVSGLNQTQVRYFRQELSDESQRIAELLRRSGIQNATSTLVNVNGTAASQIEIWFSANAFANMPQSTAPAPAAIRAYHKGRYSEAVELYDKALKEEPNSAYLLNLKGYSQFKAGKYEDALATLRRAVEVDPEYAWGYFDLARVYCKVDRRRDASEAARKAIQLRPDIRNKMRADKEFSQLCRNKLDPGIY